MEDFRIEMGWYKNLPGGRIRVLRRAVWEDPLVREDAIRFLVDEVLKKDPRKVTLKDFYDNGLSGLFDRYHSIYEALTAAGYVMEPWEMATTPPHFFDDSEMRKRAVRWLVDKLGKDPREICTEDFFSNGLPGLLVDHCNKSPYAALIEAGYKFEPWEMHRTPRIFFDDPEMRKRAVRWLVEKLGKDPREICAEDFEENGLTGLYCDHYGGSPYAAVREAGYEFEPWEMRRAPNALYHDPETRRKAVKWLVNKLQKAPHEVSKADFHNNGLEGLLILHYGGSPYAALKDAGYEFKPWIRSRIPRHFYEDPEIRKEIVKWLVEKVGKDPRKIRLKDFYDNGLSGLISHYYRQSPHAALREAGYSLEPWEMGRIPRTFFQDPENRKRAVKWLVEKLKKEPADLTHADFYKNGLSTLVASYLRRSVYTALLEACLVSEKDEARVRNPSKRTTQLKKERA